MPSQIFGVVQFGELSMEDAMMKRMAILTIALIGVAGMAQAQSMSTAPVPMPAAKAGQSKAGQSHEMQAMARTCSEPKKAAMKDEYGFRYDSRGDRLNAHGCVIAPPHMIPGAKVL